MAREMEQIRNIGIVAHIDAGKTTTTERILFYAGASHRMGNVDDGTTQTDFDPEEAQRGITIYSAAVTCSWMGHVINLIDTPGHVDFTAEVERSLRVLDGAVVVFSAVEGVEAQSETVWRQATRYQVPRICFINKMDRIGANFERVLEAMKRRLKAAPLALQIPLGQGPVTNDDGFRAVVDLLHRRVLIWDNESRGAEFREEGVPQELEDDVELWRSEILETLSLIDEEVMTVYAEEGDVPVPVLLEGLRRATLSGEIHPVLCGSSLDFIGVQPLLDAVCHFLPSPLDRPPVEGVNPKGKDPDALVARRPDVKEPVAALVFKIQAEPHGDLFFTRVYSGVLKSNSRLLNPRTGKKELVTQLWHIQSDSREKVDTVEAGDICGIIGPRDSATGDTLTDPNQVVSLESISFPETVISVAVEPESSAERKKFEDTLSRMERQDPTFQVRMNPDTGQTLVSGMGELHLEVIRHRMERDFNLKVKFHRPRVSYRERLEGRTVIDEKFSRQLPSGTLFFGLRLTAEQAEDATSRVDVSHSLPVGTLSKELMQVLLESLEREAEGGGRFGCPLMGLKLHVDQVEMREAETNEVAVRAAVSDAFRRVLSEGSLVVLEPVMALEVVTPQEFLGGIQSDLHGRRAVIVNSEHEDEICVLTCEAPLAEMFGYATQIRSLSQGRASYSMEPLRYDVAPAGTLED